MLLAKPFVSTRRSRVVLPLLLLWLATVGCGGPSTSAPPLTPSTPPGTQTAAVEPDFTIVLLPDTQSYAHNTALRPIFQSQANWIAANKQTLNIVGVAGLGDIVDCGAQDPVQWKVADDAYTVIENAGIPFAPAVGNHDLGVDCRGVAGPPRDATNYNQHFGPDRLKKYSWYGRSSYPSGSNENFYITIDRTVRKYLVLALEYRPRQEAIDWAASVIASNPDREVVVVTHALLDPSANFIYESNNLWNQLLKKYPNIILAACGHMHGASRRIDAGENLNSVTSLLSDYQAESNGGNGYLRIMKFRQGSGMIEVTTYSPHLDQFRREPENEFQIPYK